MTNNDILKKLRIALSLRDHEILEILALSDFKMTKSELSAIFRRDDHPNYQHAGDQILRKFLNGLITLKRGPKTDLQTKTAPKPVVKASAAPVENPVLN